MDNDETWKTIKDFEDHEVSNMGRIRNAISKKIRKNWKSNGYECISFYADSLQYKIYIHRIVLITFRPVERMQYLHVNHINGVKNDNRIENLEWVTPTENIRHSIVTGLKELPKENINFLVNAYDEYELYRNGKGIDEIAEEYNVSIETVKDKIVRIYSERIADI